MVSVTILGGKLEGVGMGEAEQPQTSEVAI